MTYIIGINKREDNFVTLISDIMVTESYSSGMIVRKNTALKTGLLFKGCMYGLSGDADAGYDFLLGFKQKVNKANSISENIDEFKQYIKNASWRKGDGFKILFAIRDPIPELYLFDSESSALILCNNSIVTLGSGKSALDRTVLEMQQFADNSIMKELKENNIPIVYYPSFVCLWLSELTLGFEKPYLESIGVGGVFHYCYQAGDSDNRHLPIIFVLTYLDKITKDITYKAYRISFVNGILLLDYLMDNKRVAFTSPIERMDLGGIDVMKEDNLLKEIYNRSDSLPFYYFCGFATHDPTHRGFYTCHLSCNNIKVIDKKGNIRQDFRDKITKNISAAFGNI